MVYIITGGPATGKGTRSDILAKALDIAKQKKANAAVQIYANNASNPNIAPGQSAGATSEQLKKVRASTMGLDKARKVIQDIGKDSTNVTNKLEQFATILSSMKENEGIDIISDEDIASLQKLPQELSNGDIKAEDLEETLQSILGLFTHINDSVIESAAQATQSSEKEMRDYANSVVETTNAEQRLKEESDTLQGRIKGVGDALAEAQGKQKIWSDNLVTCANSALSVVSALQMIGGIVNTIEDPDMQKKEYLKQAKYLQNYYYWNSINDDHYFSSYFLVIIWCYYKSWSERCRGYTRCSRIWSSF